MSQRSERHCNMGSLKAALLIGIPLFVATPVLAQSPALRVVVNSNQDGIVQADDSLTLREAIEIVNGTLPLDKLSPTERVQVTEVTGESRIEFSLPSGATTIQLVEILPAIARAGVVIDGTTQTGYSSQSVINERAIAAPIVAITPAAGKEVLRGLTITADSVIIRGLSLYGFTSSRGESYTGFLSGVGFTASTPPADIFISHRLPPPDIRKQQPPANFSPYYADDLPAQNVVIENNWLGAPPTLRDTGEPVVPENRSAFGVSVFNGSGTTVRNNWIAYHDGSAIITSVRATGLQVSQNVLTGNGVAGMPDAIRLEGNVNQSQISGNLICGNDGSGVYLFKPEGSVQVQDNQIIFNGRRLRRAAVYLMGTDHTVTGNEIRYQAGPGVVVAAYPESRRASIQTNRFSNLEGLSVDLVNQFGSVAGTDVRDYQTGDGANPQRNSPNRRPETGNAAINSPRFVSQEFVEFSTDTPVQVFGQADPGSRVEIYRVSGVGDGFGPLSEPIAIAETDAKGNFSSTVAGLQVGQRISAIATNPAYGTSEPARNAIIRTVDGTTPEAPTPQAATSLPRCVTPVAQVPPTIPPATTPIRLKVPKVIHFALDQDFISPASARVLNRIAQVLKENPSILVEIVGHTDPRASDAYNLNLGLRRARSARNYLLRQGVAPERMTIRTLGERQLISPGRNRVDFARDRRAEFIYKDIRDIEVIVQEEDLQIEP